MTYAINMALDLFRSFASITPRSVGNTALFTPIVQENLTNELNAVRTALADAQINATREKLATLESDVQTLKQRTVQTDPSHLDPTSASYRADALVSSDALQRYVVQKAEAIRDIDVSDTFDASSTTTTPSSRVIGNELSKYAKAPTRSAFDATDVVTDKLSVQRRGVRGHIGTSITYSGTEDVLFRATEYDGDIIDSLGKLVRYSRFRSGKTADTGLYLNGTSNPSTFDDTIDLSILQLQGDAVAMVNVDLNAVSRPEVATRVTFARLAVFSQAETGAIRLKAEQRFSLQNKIPNNDGSSIQHGVRLRSDDSILFFGFIWDTPTADYPTSSDDMYIQVDNPPTGFAATFSCTIMYQS